MHGTYTTSATTTWTDATIRYVMSKVAEDLLNQANAGLITRSKADKWRDDFSYLLRSQAVECFQVQFHRPDGRKAGVGYRVIEGGHVVIDDDSGGLGYFGFPDGTTASAVVSYRSDHPNIADVYAEMRRRGWGSGGKLMTGGSAGPTYSQNGCGVERERLGDWDDE